MRTFVVIWSGQLLSMMGSYMTVFAVILWVWQVTESASALTLISFFSLLPRIPMTLIAGAVVDRLNRKTLMLLGDGSAALCTLVVGLLYLGDRLQIWHLCGAVAVHGCFGQLQQLAYTSAIAQLLPAKHHTRASSMNSAIRFSGAIAAPALAGSLYPVLGLGGMIAVDLATFAVALGTLLSAQIPSLDRATAPAGDRAHLWKELGFGFHYIRQTPGLLAMVIVFTLFAIPNDLGYALYNPLVLARSNGNAQLLGAVTTAGGVGGLLGAVLCSVWGGFRPRFHGILLGFIGAGISRLVFSLGQEGWIWMVAQALAAFHTPLFLSSTLAIWYARVPMAIQGRVLAVDQLIGLGVGAIATVMAGPLAERLFEPALQAGQPLSRLIPLFGSGNGAGMAVLFAMTALGMILVGVGGYLVTPLKQLDSDQVPLEG